MKKGIIMDIDSHFITLLTPDGEFLQTPKQQKIYTIGEEITFLPDESRNAKKKQQTAIFSFFKTKSALISAVAALVLILSFLPSYFSNQVYAYMTIDINPSVEIGVNKDLKVVKIKGLNKDGQEIVNHISNWKKESFNKVADNFIKQSRKSGFIHQKSEIVVSTVVVNKNRKNFSNLLKKQVDAKELSKQAPEAKLTLLNATVSDREKAIEKGISTGKYLEESMRNDSNDPSKAKKGKNSTQENMDSKANEKPKDPNKKSSEQATKKQIQPNKKIPDNSSVRQNKHTQIEVNPSSTYKREKFEDQKKENQSEELKRSYNNNNYNENKHNDNYRNNHFNGQNNRYHNRWNSHNPYNKEKYQLNQGIHQKRQDSFENRSPRARGGNVPPQVIEKRNIVIEKRNEAKQKKLKPLKSKIEEKKRTFVRDKDK